MEEASAYFAFNLEKNKEARQYLLARGMEEKTIKDFRIGYAEDGWRNLFSYLLGKGYKEADMEKAGLIKKIEGKEGYYDRFRNRIIFPMADSSSRIVAFSGRIFGEGEPKYLNSPETPIFHKSSILYGLDRAKNSIRKNNFSILVEGQMDLVLSHQAGFKNTVATSGTALSEEADSRENQVSNLGLVRRLSPNIVLAYDADKAGIKAAERAAKLALSLGMDVKAAQLPSGADPADLIKSGGPDAWRKAIREAKHIIEFLLDDILKSEADPRKAGREIKEKVLPFVAVMESAIEQAHFVKLASEKAGIPAEALKEDLKKISIPGREFTEREKEIQPKRIDHISRRFAGVLLWQKEASPQKIDAEKLAKEFEEIFNSPLEEFLNSLEINQADAIFEAEIFYGNFEVKDLEREIRELAENLLEEKLKEKLLLKMRELAEAEGREAADESKMILSEISDINRKIDDIKKGRINLK